jgi:hypothetical protein
MSVASQSPPVASERFSMLLSPFRIRDVELRNRFVFQPHFTALGTLDGQPTDAHIAYHEEDWMPPRPVPIRFQPSY